MAALTLAGLLLLAVDAATPAAPSTPSLQQRFDAATDAWQSGDCAKALPLFAALAEDRRVAPGSLPAAAIAVRRGDCLVTAGDSDTGEAMLQAGLPKLSVAGETFDAEVIKAETTLGSLAQRRWDHDGALAHYRAALARLQGAERMALLMRIAVLTAFDSGDEPLAAADEGLRLAAAGPKPDKQVQSQFMAAHARILMNQGRLNEARSELLKAYDLSGGELTRISVPDAALRADLAQVSMLTRHSEDAYFYMARTGAGRIGDSPFINPVLMSAPPCGPDTGLAPEDAAVVEFSMADDGAVRSAQAVYATGNYAKASAFARAVAQWRWKPEDVAKMAGFYRASSRVELRCTNADLSQRNSPLTPLGERFDAWAGPVLQPYQARLSGKRGEVPWLAMATAAAAAGDSGAELAARVGLAARDARNDSEATASLNRALELARRPELPPQAAVAAQVVLTAWGRRYRDSRTKYDPTWTDDTLLALARQPGVAADALAQDTALLMALPTRIGANNAPARETLQQISGDSRLADHHPLRQLADLRLANEAARAGNLADAQQWFARTGLNAQQCALIGPKPAVTSINRSFPEQALDYGFEGWVQVEFDINADGHTAQVRPLIAYPPFIFVQAATSRWAGATYQATYRPESGAACSANVDYVRYRILGNDTGAKEIKQKAK